MADPVVVEPKPGVSPVAETAPPAETDQTASLPDEVLRVPAIQAIFAGSPPAVSAPIEEFASRPEGKLVMANKEALMKAGMGLYRSVAGDLGVLFNQMYVHPEELKAADAAGKLLELAPPFDSVNPSVAASGENHPSLQKREVPGGFKTFTPPAVQQPPMVAPPPAKAQTKLMTARVNAQSPGSPTSGPVPGAGRLLNSILKQPL